MINAIYLSNNISPQFLQQYLSTTLLCFDTETKRLFVYQDNVEKDFTLDERNLDLGKYALRSEIPDVSNFIYKSQVYQKFALKEEIPDVKKFLTLTFADSRYALKSQIPDVSRFISKTQAYQKFALKEDIPDVSQFLTLSFADSRYALKSQIPSFLKHVDYNITTKSLNFLFELNTGDEYSSTVYVGDLVDTYTAGNGIKVQNNIVSANKEQIFEDFDINSQSLNVTKTNNKWNVEAPEFNLNKFLKIVDNIYQLEHAQPGFLYCTLQNED